LLDQVRAFPDDDFPARRRQACAPVHQGYSGPATGAEHQKNCANDFERLIDELLADKKTAAALNP